MINMAFISIYFNSDFFLNQKLKKHVSLKKIALAENKV